MNTLSLENINNHAPYGVRHREDNFYSFYFETDFGLKYTISFMLENSFVQSGAFQFCINVEGAGRSPGDVKLRQTVFAIIEEFFAVNGKEAMLYLCETGDEKEGLRNRLFIRWFNTYEHREGQTPLCQCRSHCRCHYRDAAHMKKCSTVSLPLRAYKTEKAP